jgi:hypothetical protein
VQQHPQILLATSPSTATTLSDLRMHLSSLAARHSLGLGGSHNRKERLKDDFAREASKLGSYRLTPLVHSLRYVKVLPSISAAPSPPSH